MRNRFVIFALCLLLLTLPVAAAEDFSQRDTCYWLVGVFTDGSVDSAELDRCDSEGGQKGSNDMQWGVHVTAEEDAPPGSPAGADSTHHIGTPSSAGAITADEFASADFATGAWWLFDNADEKYWIGRFGSDGSSDGSWQITRFSSLETRWKTGGTWHVADGLGVELPNDTWSFFVISHDAGTGSGTMRTYSSESQIENTLFDCTGGTQVCNTETDPMSGDKTYVPTGNITASFTLYGNLYENWLLAELPSPEETCQMCQCGFQNDVRGVGRIDLCNRCEVRPYQGCRRFID